MIHFELIFVQGVRSVPRFFFFFASGCLVVPAPFVEETNFAPLYHLYFFVRDQLTIFMGVYFWALYSDPVIYLFILSPISYCLDYCNFIVSLEVHCLFLFLWVK